MADLQKPIIMAAGGTGGHVFPAQALASELLKQGHKIYFFSDGRGHQFNDSSFSNVTIRAGQLQGSFGKKVKGGLELMVGAGAALYHLKRLKPKAVVGFGGYASFPTMIAGVVLRIPTVVHQSDAYLGRTNRFLARFVTRIATSFPHVENIPSGFKKKVSLTGLPVRPDIKPEPYQPSTEQKPFHIFVIGGSQGARVFGEVVPKAVALLDPLLQKRLYIRQQCRPESIEATQKLYKKTQAQVELSPFWDHMGEQYKKAHLVISRAGASSVGEIALVGRPAIFVPYPYAMDDHQSYNAKQACAVKGSWVIQEKDLTPRALATSLSDLMTSPWKLEEAAGKMQTLSIADAPLRLAHLVKLIAD